METKLKVRILAHTPEPERVIANSARLCYSDLGIDDLFTNYTDEQNKNMIDSLMKVGHESPLEHISFTFGVEGISRSLSHQLVRHRIGSSYSQKSQRYVSEDGFSYVIPEDIKNNPSALHIFTETMEYIQLAYVDIADKLMSGYCMQKPIEDMSNDNLVRGLKKSAMENARAVLPNACETKIIVTMNARALLNFFNLRCCNRSQKEIRDLADEMLRQVKSIAPSVFRLAGAKCMFGKCPEGKMSCKNKRKVEEYEQKEDK